MVLDYQEALVKLVEEIIEKPLATLGYNQSVEEIIKELDGFVDNYILTARKLVEVYLLQAYQSGVIDATEKLNKAAGQDIKPLVSDHPEKLDFLISMHQRNVEDYALVLRGRLRSSIETKKYLEA